MHRIAIFASGGGSNAECIIKHFQDRDSIQVSLIVTNNKTAKVLERAANHKIPTVIISSSELGEGSKLKKVLQDNEITFIALAGFLKKIPLYLINLYPRKMVNIHPALLPKFGGKGMYGNYVHQAVFDANEKESGPTIHYVTENYDEGQIVFQKSVALLPTDTPDLIGKKVLALEHEHYPRVIEKVLTDV